MRRDKFGSSSEKTRKVDETPVQIFKEEGKKSQSKSYIRLYLTGKDGKALIIPV